MGMFATWRREVAHLDKAPCLFLKTSHQLRESEAASVITLPRKAAEIADRLKMDAPYSGSELEGLPHHGANGIGVHPSHKGGDKDDAKTCFLAILDGHQFFVEECPSPQRAIYRIINPVELKKDR
jgi:hypothetical protein